MDKDKRKVVLVSSVVLRFIAFVLLATSCWSVGWMKATEEDGKSKTEIHVGLWNRCKVIISKNSTQYTINRECEWIGKGDSKYDAMRAFMTLCVLACFFSCLCELGVLRKFEWDTSTFGMAVLSFSTVCGMIVMSIYTAENRNNIAILRARPSVPANFEWAFKLGWSGTFLLIVLTVMDMCLVWKKKKYTVQTSN
jgi:PMP-22/EMP/MP20/Claudin family.